ncbi:MAG: ABC transporter permease [Nitrospirae bacterium]|nr:ABC transporter permease [Nitrospirota bacterium]
MFIIKIIIRNASRHSLRTFLTVLGVTVAVLAFGLLQTIVSAWYAGVDASSASRLVARNAISLVFSLPISYRDKIRQVEGVQTVSYGNWFGGIYIDEKNFFANFAFDLRTYLELYPEYIIPEEQKKELLLDRKAAVVGAKTAHKYGWKVGDTVTLRGTIFPGNWDFTIRAIYNGRDKNVDETQFFFHWDYFSESLKKGQFARRSNEAGIYVIGIEKPELAAEVSQRIDGMFKNSMAETLTETEKAFQMSFISMTEAIIIAVKVVSFLVIFIILAVVANTMAMTARERLREYAVFRCLGFGMQMIVLIIIGESLLITTAGGGLAILCTFPLAKVFGDYMSTYIPIFNVTNETLLLDVVISLTVGVLACVIPVWYALRMKLAEGLRAVV